MKRILIIGALGVFVLGMTSCGAGHTCDAYRTADYTKYKIEKTKKAEKPVASAEKKKK